MATRKIEIKWDTKSNKYKRQNISKSTWRKYFSKPLRDTRDKAWRHYKTIVKDWSSGNQPKFVRVTKFENVGGYGLTYYSSVGIDDNYTPLFWLSEGTKWRARKMSWNWKSRTYPGMGIAAQRSPRGFATNTWGRYPGIKPRRFREGIIDDISKDFYYDMSVAFDRMHKDLWA